ncbi:hypothetical protein GUITHDRAFT_162101 [Guillardia theta CCMP2712]|uniref:protein O-GlcNAc transferase n=1 Tax=Guillardia theta (strain CCMP2712) TaxID=905079 RepID=L1JMH1_GUITC|nr:hypothetical protein GUITHDRAFT_162101 [Guillardia theta CCMP2712]EKX49771.1 hypothetical protein GUITHDRAFT_162101 [Guillardia theta CCMP2712]|eukprot:XP_005836751.1 hypothetical protein GUITHDRAFT_162101 [Guillardia theta CCMP2712]
MKQKEPWRLEKWQMRTREAIFTILLICCECQTPGCAVAHEVREMIRHMCSGVDHIIDMRQRKRTYLMCLRWDPFDVEIRMSLGMLAHSQGWYDEAKWLFESTLKLPVNSAAQHDAHNFLGVMHETSFNDPGQARQHFEAALTVNPMSSQAHHNLANLYWRTWRREEAFVHYRKALHIEPHNTFFVYGLASAMLQSDESRESLENAKMLFLKAITLSPNFADAYRGLGHALRDLGFYEEASRAYQKSYQMFSHLKGEQRILRAHQIEAKLLHFSALLAICDLHSIETILADVKASLGHYLAGPDEVSSHKDAISYYLDVHPLNVNLYDIAHIVDPLVLLQIARRRGYALTKLVKSTILYQQIDSSNTFQRNVKLKNVFKVAMLSSRFDGDHYITHAIITLLKACKPALLNDIVIEFHVISSARVTPTKERTLVMEKLKNESNSFIYAYSMSWHQIALHINSLNCHLYLDLDGYTRGAMTEVSVLQASPLQAHWFGNYSSDFGGYSWGDAMPTRRDSRVVDCEILIPKMNRSKIIFANFNSLYKIDPALVNVWKSALFSSNDKSWQLWITNRPKKAAENLKNHLTDSKNELRQWSESEDESLSHQFFTSQEKEKFSDELILVTDLQSAKDHIRVKSCADIFLDSFRLGSHSTAADALAAGLVLVTLPHIGALSRVASSLLAASGASATIVRTSQEYHDLLQVWTRRTVLGVRYMRKRLSRRVYRSDIWRHEQWAKKWISLIRMWWDAYVALSCEWQLVAS